MIQVIKHSDAGKEFEASYEIFDDTIRVLLPDGSTRETQLRGLKPEHAALTHLRAYISSLSKRT